MVVLVRFRMDNDCVLYPCSIHTAQQVFYGGSGIRSIGSVGMIRKFIAVGASKTVQMGIDDRQIAVGLLRQRPRSQGKACN